MKGQPLIGRNDRYDLIIDKAWSGTSHTCADHAWVAAAFGHLIDWNGFLLADARPAEFMLGVIASYFRSDFDVEQVLAEPDIEFIDRVQSFKMAKNFEQVRPSLLVPTIAIEECQAIVAQFLHYSGFQPDEDGRRSRIIEQFHSDIWNAITGDGSAAYAPCFKLFSVMAEDDDLNDCIEMLGLICDLALNPPLPFLRDGTPIRDWHWEDFHPTLRFLRLADTALRRRGPKCRSLLRCLDRNS